MYITMNSHRIKKKIWSDCLNDKFASKRLSHISSYKLKIWILDNNITRTIFFFQVHTKKLESFPLITNFISNEMDGILNNTFCEPASLTIYLVKWDYYVYIPRTAILHLLIFFYSNPELAYLLYPYIYDKTIKVGRGGGICVMKDFRGKRYYNI